MSHKISRCVDMGNDRIIVIKIENNNNDILYIVGVYPPQQRCYITNFEECTDLLSSIISKCKLDGEVIIIGDYNCHFGVEMGIRGTGATTPSV